MANVPHVHTKEENTDLHIIKRQTKKKTDYFMVVLFFSKTQ